MKLIDAALIYQDFLEMEGDKLSIKQSYRLDQLIGKLERHATFFSEKERALVNKSKPKLIEGTSVEFDTPEQAARFRYEHDELKNIEVDLGNFKPLELDINDNIKIDRKALHRMIDAGIVVMTGIDDEEGETAEGETAEGETASDGVVVAEVVPEESSDDNVEIEEIGSVK